MIRGPDGRATRVHYVLPRHKAANWVGPGRGRKSTRPGANGVVELTPFEFLDRLYAVYDGTFWGQHVDRAKPDWQAEQKLSLVRFDHTTGSQVDFKPGVRFAELGRYSVGPGSPQKLPDRVTLAGMVFHAGRLYVGDFFKGGILDVDPVTGDVARTIRLRSTTRPGLSSRPMGISG